MLEVTCKLLQCVQLGGIFTITPVWMGDGTVKLHIVACDGGYLSRVKPVLPAENLIWLQGKQNPQSSSDS
ncbi:MAG: hypothetical protein K0U59_03375 [Gammaproteobacteria bacterium]|nr:hypothetical protein [Gammaproteobacteria bacterium]